MDTVWSQLVTALPKALDAAEQLREIHDMQFGRIEVVIGGGKARRIIPSYELRESQGS